MTRVIRKLDSVGVVSVKKGNIGIMEIGEMGMEAKKGEESG